MFTCTSGDEPNSPGRQGCLCCRREIQAASRRIDAQLSRRGFVAGMGASLASLGFVRRAGAETGAGPRPPVAFTNFLLFDGKSSALRGGLRLLVEGNLIKTIAAGDLTLPESVRVIDCGGRVVMPGLIDAHWHTIFAALPVAAPVHGGPRLHLSRRQRRSRAHLDARLHNGPGPRRPVLPPQAGDRRRACVGPPDLSVGRDDHDHRRPWRPASPVRSAEESRADL